MKLLNILITPIILFIRKLYYNNIKGLRGYDYHILRLPLSDTDILNIQRSQYNDIRKNLLKHIFFQIEGLQSLDYLGKGYYGVAFKYNKRTKTGVSKPCTIKFTTDNDEALLWRKILNSSEKYQSLCEVYDIIEIYTNTGKCIGYVILKEYVKKHELRINELFLRYVSSATDAGIFGKDNFIFKEYPIDEAIKYIKDNMVKPDSTKYNSYLNNLIEFYHNRYIFQRELGRIKKLFSWERLDIHEENWGFNNKGDFKIFDISGYKSS